MEKANTVTQAHMHTEPSSVADDELNDLAATGDAYLGGVTSMSWGMQTLTKASASAPLDSECQPGSARAAMHENYNPDMADRRPAITSALRQRPSCSALFRSCSSVQSPTATTFVFDD